MCSLLQSQGEWCVAKSTTDNEKLIKNINFACSKIDCSIILEGGSCYLPDNPLNHASVAMNLYFQAQGRHHWNCDFEGSGLITVIDPSEFNLFLCLFKQLCKSFSVSLDSIFYYFSLFIFRRRDLQI